MSMDPGVMQQMLSQQLMQPAQQSTFGGGNAGPAMVGNSSSIGGIGAQVAQKLMLMKALQNSQATQQQQTANAMLPKTNQMMQQDPTLQALQQSPQIPMPATPSG